MTGYTALDSFSIKHVYYDPVGPRHLGSCSTARIEIESPVVRVEQMNGASITLRRITGLESYRYYCASRSEEQCTSGQFALGRYMPDRDPDTIQSEVYTDILFIPIGCPESKWHLDIVGLHFGRRRGCCNYERLGYFSMEHEEYFNHFNRILVSKCGWPYEPTQEKKRLDKEPFTKKLLEALLLMPRDVITLV